MFLWCSLLASKSVQAQDLDNFGSRTLEKVRNSPLRLNGGLSANSIFYASNGRESREPFTYFLQGFLNVTWLSFTMPVSYSLTNQESQLGYETPFKFNRISLHPKYKWIQSHIGDVAMTFSPYTLNGHQFTGAGVELTPEGGFSLSAITGRLLQATEDDEQPQTLPAFRRMGYGTKLGWQNQNYRVGLIGFYVKDEINSITSIPEAKGITPKENLVISLDGQVTLAKHYTIDAEFASSAITQYLRAATLEDTGEGITGLFIQNRGSTAFYNAFRVGFAMQLESMQVGLGYERIDPGYETLGAYFFNNDFENITLNASRPFFNNKFNLSFNIGYQTDNLDNQKLQATNRFVGSINATLQATDKINITGSYSNFSTFTNQRLNQFDDINDSDLTDDYLQALDYKQLS